jgi:hypothetical protein
MHASSVVFRHTCSAPCALALAIALATTPVAAAPTESDTIRTDTDSTDCARFAPSHGEGFFLAMPAHLYGDLSTFGLHAGWQFPSAQLRLDLSVAERSRVDEDSYFALPALGLYASHELATSLRMYEGFSVGFQRGIHDAFEGTAWFVDYRAGLEVIPRKDCSVFLEVGSGTGLVRKEGAFHGGTIIGGGVKYWVFP